MITDHSETLPVIQGLILLDCWEPQVRSHLFKDKFYINLIEKIGNKYFQCIINSVNKLQVDLSDHCIANTMKLCQYNDNHPIMRNLLQQSGDEKTSSLLSKYLFREHGHPISIIDRNDFVWFATNYLPDHSDLALPDHATPVQNWLVAGHTWQMCTHEHALGLHVLADLTKQYPLNFYATDYSFCKLTEQTATLEDFEQDSMNWCLIKDFGYQLLSRTQSR